MPSNRPSDELFQSRLNDLVGASSASEVASRFGTSTRSVNRWLRGGSAPRSSAIARSVSRTALRDGVSVPVIQATDSEGRFTTTGQITDRRAIGYVSRQRERLVDRRNVAIRAANTPASRAAANALPTSVDMNFVRELQSRRRNLLSRGAAGDMQVPRPPPSTSSDDGTYEEANWGGWGDETSWGWDSWDDWRDDLVGSYEQVSG